MRVALALAGLCVACGGRVDATTESRTLAAPAVEVVDAGSDTRISIALPDSGGESAAPPPPPDAPTSCAPTGPEAPLDFDLGELAERCPVELPEAGAACHLPSRMQCAYGNDPRPACRPTATCEDGLWTIRTYACKPLITGSCPADRPAQGASCDLDSELCTYGERSCICRCLVGSSVGCATCDSTQLGWDCGSDYAWCGQVPPRLGSKCSDDNKGCFTGDCMGTVFDSEQTCLEGVWQPGIEYGGDGPCE